MARWQHSVTGLIINRLWWCNVVKSRSGCCSLNNSQRAISCFIHVHCTVYVCLYACTCVRIYVGTYARICTYTYVFCAYVRVCARVCVCVCACVCACVRTFVRSYVYVACMRTTTHNQTQSSDVLRGCVGGGGGVHEVRGCPRAPGGAKMCRKFNCFTHKF